MIFDVAQLDKNKNLSKKLLLIKFIYNLRMKKENQDQLLKLMNKKDVDGRIRMLKKSARGKIRILKRMDGRIRLLKKNRGMIRIL